MQIARTVFIEQLIETLRTQLNKAEHYKIYTEQQLNYKSNPKSWSALECIEHLNLYGDFYIPEIKKCMAKKRQQAENTYKSGRIGDYFVKSMEPKEKLNKMKTFKDKNPLGSQLNKDILNRFIQQQKDYLNLLEKAGKTNFIKTKTSITLTKYIKIRLGDTFRFVLAHNARHLVQADNVLLNAKL